MKHLRLLILFLAINLFCALAFSQEINVCIAIRGNTGLEEKVKEAISQEFKSFDHVFVIEDKDACHLYLDLALVEQEPIHFYALGVSIAYHVRGDFYSRPTSDVTQFGEERMEEVCRYLAKEIDRFFLEPLRHPAGE